MLSDKETTGKEIKRQRENDRGEKGSVTFSEIVEVEFGRPRRRIFHQRLEQ